MKPNIFFSFILPVCLLCFNPVILKGQEYGRIEITSFPDSAEVIINGIKTNAFTPFKMEFKAGNYTFSLIRGKYQKYEGSFTLTAGQTERISCNLAPGNGMVRISTNPNNAAVFIDSLYYGNSPLFVENLKSGVHYLEIRKEMFNSYVNTFTFDSKLPSDIVVNLEARFGSIGILADPDADIFIDGLKVGTHFYSGRIFPGTHDIEISRKGYINQIKKIEVQKGEEINLSFMLDKILGRISVISEPQGAEVYLNEKYKGMTPKYLDSLELGTYHVAVRMSDFKPWYDTINISSSNPVPVYAPLLWGEKVTIISTPQETIDAAGIWGWNFLVTLVTPGDNDRLRQYKMKTRINPLPGGAEMGLSIDL